MGSANSVNISRSEEENLSINQREPSPITPGEEESKTLTEDSVSIATSKEDDPPTNQGESNGDESKTLTGDSNETEEKEEEGSEECGYCTYIKLGECKESWIELEKCFDEAKKNDGESDVTKCKEARKMFKTCLYDNPVYYEPIIAEEADLVAKMLSGLQGVKEAILADKAQEVAKMLSELEAEKEAILAGDAASIVKALSKLQNEEEEPLDILPAEAAVIAKRFSELEAEKKKEKKEKESKGSEGNQ